MKTAFLAWRDPQSHAWFPIARVRSDNGGFFFEYVNGAEKAGKTGRFKPIAPFDELDKIHYFDSLFPLLANRLLSTKREDFAQFIQWLGLPSPQNDPLVLLGRSGASRQTDDFEMFSLPESDAQGRIEIHFFVHGQAHFPLESMERVLRLKKDDSLLVVWDMQNPYDPRALGLRTNETLGHGDRFLIGYCPRYLNSDLLTALAQPDEPPRITVERVNPPPAPPQVRLLCRLTARTTPEFSFFTSGDFVALSGQPEIAHS